MLAREEKSQQSVRAHNSSRRWRVDMKNMSAPEVDFHGGYGKRTAGY